MRLKSRINLDISIQLFSYTHTFIILYSTSVFYTLIHLYKHGHIKCCLDVTMVSKDEHRYATRWHTLMTVAINNTS